MSSSGRLEEWGIDPTTNERLKVIRKENQRGERVVYHVNGQGQLHGTWRTYTPNGKQLLEECVYKNGIFHGHMLSYHSNGKMSSIGNYVEGRPEGHIKSWHENGQLHKNKFYKDGFLEGEVEVWYADGNPCEKSTYAGGKRIGSMQYWSLSGKYYLL